MVSFKQVLIVGMLVAFVGACSGDDEADEQTTPTTTVGPTLTTIADQTGGTELAAVATTTTTTTTTEAPALAFPEYRIVSREAGESGDVLVVLLDESSYESLSDLDIHGVMTDLVELFSPVYEAHIVETQAAADALFVENPTEEQQTALDNSYIARLEEGFRIVYVGRFSELPADILGS